jgi:cytohesin
MSKLHKAIKSGDVEAVRALLARGEDVSAREHVTHLTPLHRAAALGHADIAQLLIEAGAEVDGRSKNGRTPLHEAASTGRAELVPLLLEAGADVNATNHRGETPLDVARIAGWVDKAHADKYEPAITALRAAGGESRRQEAMEFISGRGVKELRKHVQRGEVEAVELLEDDDVRAVVAKEPRYGLDWLLGLALAGDTSNSHAMEVEPVQWAFGGHRMTSGHSEIAHALIARGAHVDVRMQAELNDRGRALLWERFPPRFEYDPSHISWVGMLADPGTPFAKGDKGPTPLFLAVMNDDAGLVDALIRAGADPDTRTTDDHTALHWAVLFGATAAAAHLLKGGADVNARTARHKETPLTWATRRAVQKDLPPAGRDSAAAIADLLRSHGGVV